MAKANKFTSIKISESSHIVVEKLVPKPKNGEDEFRHVCTCRSQEQVKRVVYLLNEGSK